MNENEIKKCAKCKGIVNLRKKLCCVVCHNLFHPDCAEVDDRSYLKIRDLGDKVLWVCETCREKRNNNKISVSDGNDSHNLHKPINHLLNIIERLSENNCQMNKKLDTVIEANERLTKLVLSLESKIKHQTPSSRQAPFHDQPHRKYNKANRSDLFNGKNQFLEDESNNYIYKHPEDEHKEKLNEGLVKKISDDSYPFRNQPLRKYNNSTKCNNECKQELVEKIPVNKIPFYDQSHRKYKTDQLESLRDRNKFHEDEPNDTKCKYYKPKHKDSFNEKLVEKILDNSCPFRDEPLGAYNALIANKSNQSKLSRDRNPFLKDESNASKCNNKCKQIPVRRKISQSSQEISFCDEPHTTIANKSNQSKLSRDRNPFLEDESYAANFKYYEPKHKKMYNEELVEKIPDNSFPFCNQPHRNTSIANKANQSKRSDEELVLIKPESLGTPTKKKLTYEFSPDPLIFRNRKNTSSLDSESSSNAKSSPSSSGLVGINKLWKFLGSKPKARSASEERNAFFGRTHSVPNVSGRGTPRPSQKINRDTFAKQCLERHNKYRAMHLLNPLKLNSELSAFAQDWADHLASVQTMTHRTKNRYGENLWAFMTTDPNHQVHGGDAVDSWYKDELDKYTFGTEPKDLKAGHLTQVLWAGSERLGVGVSKSGNYTFVVCNYDPPGNYKGEYADNVPPVGGWKDKEKRKQANSSSDSLEAFIKDSLRIHNEYRAKHGAPPMALDANISKYAQEWADQLAQNNSFKHRSNNIYGENLFWSSGRASAKVMCDGWYSEEAGYDYSVDPIKDKGSLKSGHFTQLVWKESKYLGIGRAFTKSGEMIGVANYSPRGNIVGQFTSSVLPPVKRR